MQYALAINSGCVAGGQCPLLEAEADIPPTHPLRPSLTHLGSPANRARNMFVRTARGVCSFSPKFSPKILRRAFDEEHDMPEFLSEADRAELDGKIGRFADKAHREWLARRQKGAAGCGGAANCPSPAKPVSFDARRSF